MSIAFWFITYKPSLNILGKCPSISSVRPCLSSSYRQGGTQWEAEAMLIIGQRLGWRAAWGFYIKHSIFHVDEFDPLSSENTRGQSVSTTHKDFALNKMTFESLTGFIVSRLLRTYSSLLVLQHLTRICLLVGLALSGQQPLINI